MLLLLTVVSLLSSALAVPRTVNERGLSIPLLQRAPATEPDDIAAWALSQANRMRSKYAPESPSKRSEGFNAMVNQNLDTTYYGSLAVGTPPTSYDVILDTGSADLWLASSTCTTGCSSVPQFDPSSSSSFRNLSTAFQITYGSGAARGFLVQDTVQMAGFSIPSQTFALCNQISANLLTSPVSGLLGLGWKQIASSGATPFWQGLVQGGSWTAPLMSFVLTRFNNVSTANAAEPGGVFTMGYTNSSLFTGDIEYTNIPTGSQSYWLIPLTDINVQGSSVVSGSQNAAIDTGTTLIGGPAAAIAAVFAAIPGSVKGTGNYDGYWLYPCATDVKVTMTYGTGKAWPISSSDFQLQQISKTQCLGAFFEIDTSGSTAPQWIVGDTFLKNVMSVYRFNPPSVGFASLAPPALALIKGAVPTPTIGANTVSPTGRTSSALPSTAGASISMALGAALAVSLVSFAGL